jgi:hypothetical protein
VTRTSASISRYPSLGTALLHDVDNVVRRSGVKECLAPSLRLHPSLPPASSDLSKGFPAPPRSIAADPFSAPPILASGSATSFPATPRELKFESRKARRARHARARQKQGCSPYGRRAASGNNGRNSRCGAAWGELSRRIGLLDLRMRKRTRDNNNKQQKHQQQQYDCDDRDEKGDAGMGCT